MVVEFIHDRLGSPLERDEIKHVLIRVERPSDFHGDTVVVAVQPFAIVAVVRDEMRATEEEVILAQAAHTACVWEVRARKVGNVHPGAGFADLNYLDFVRSAGALMQALTECRGAVIGETILRAVQLRREVTPSNTNLGIILLLVPLAKSQDRAGLTELLRRLTVADAHNCYEAIRSASAGGLGETVEQSVNDEPTVTLLEAMRLAADRDLIAKQYATGFADIFDSTLARFPEPTDDKQVKQTFRML